MKRIAKWAATAVAFVVVLAVGAYAAIYASTERAIKERVQLAPMPVEVPTDAESIARGERLLAIRGCVDCHGKDYGGATLIDDPVMGRFAGTNLTRGEGGIGGTYSVDDWVGAIRHGIAPDGRKLVFMPSYEYARVDDEDLGQMIAFLQSLPPVERTAASIRVGPMARVLTYRGELKLLAADHIDHGDLPPPAPEAAPTAAYGAYMAASCIGCHGDGFSGGRIPGTPPDWPPATNLTMDEASGLAGWELEDFRRALREGIRPDGAELREPYMPIAMTKHLTDVEIEAIWAYLQTLPPKPAGNR